MNIADTLILADLATMSLILSQLSGELAFSSTLFFYISGSILASLPLLGLIGIIFLQDKQEIYNYYNKATVLQRVATFISKE